MKRAFRFSVKLSKEDVMGYVAAKRPRCQRRIRKTPLLLCTFILTAYALWLRHLDTTFAETDASGSRDVPIASDALDVRNVSAKLDFVHNETAELLVNNGTAELLVQNGTAELILNNETAQLDIVQNDIADVEIEPTSAMVFVVTPFVEALKKVVSADNMVLLALADVGFENITINFYLTSIRPFGIENYLIITLNPKTCKKFKPYMMNCFHYKNSLQESDTPTEIGAPLWIEKMNIRADFIIEALRAGISVLHTDVDVLFLKHPFYHIPCNIPECDLASLVDYYDYNAGFVLVHPSAIAVYKSMKELSAKYPKMNDQTQLNEVIKERVKDKRLKFLELPKAQFQSGRLFYNDAKRVFADSMKPCPECVVVHNNWIIGVERKIFRAKELHHWYVDENGYYTNPKAMYMTYANAPTSNQDDQLTALKTALAFGTILNRIVVLPKFYVSPTWVCSLQVIVDFKAFDDTFSGIYREHSFLTHPLVPKAVKQSAITTTVGHESLNDKEVKDRFGAIEESVVKLGSMHLNITFQEEDYQTNFDHMIKIGVKKK